MECGTTCNLCNEVIKNGVNMIGKRLYKPVQIKDYAEASMWCTENNATIEEKDTYFEIVAIPGPTLQELKEEKLKEISVWTEKLITNGFTYNGVKYDSDLDTQITMQGIALNVHTAQFAEKYPDGCPVRGYDEGSSIKTIHMLSADDVLGFCAALSIHIGESKKLGWTLQQRVAQAKTKDELDAIVWAEIK